MYTVIYLPHAADATHLHAVIAEMRQLGAPTIRLVDCGDHYVALEGVHRLHAVMILGLAPNLVILEQEALISADSLDLDTLVSGETYTAGELAGELYSQQNVILRFENDGRLSA